MKEELKDEEIEVNSLTREFITAAKSVLVHRILLNSGEVTMEMNLFIKLTETCSQLLDRVEKLEAAALR